MTRFDRYRIRKGLILAFHGCDSDVAHSVVQGGDLARSENTYDWLGHGVYFWENNPERALEWAEHAAKRGRLKSPAVLGAIIDLGHCLDLTESVGCDEVAEIHETIKLIETANPDLIPPVNKGKTNDRILRHRDCHVINQLHRQREQRGHPAYTSVRAAFHEGGPLYENAGFSRRAHLQICIRHESAILGYFLPKESNS